MDSKTLEAVPNSLLYRQDREDPGHKLPGWKVFTWIYPSTKTIHSGKSNHPDGESGCYQERVVGPGSQKHPKAMSDAASFRKSEVLLHLWLVQNSQCFAE